jgi:hypothetical protein
MTASLASSFVIEEGKAKLISRNLSFLGWRVLFHGTPGDTMSVAMFYSACMCPKKQPMQLVLQHRFFNEWAKLHFS